VSDAELNPTWIRRGGQVGGPLAFAIMAAWQPLNIGAEIGPQQVVLANLVVAVMAWMLIWWVFEAVPLAVTALLPMFLFPLLGVLSPAEVAGRYGSEIIYLFFGGFVLALGLEQQRLHVRIALGILRLTGVSPRRLVFGFMLSTALLSMWISNTATTVMMLPMAVSVLQLTGEAGDSRTNRAFATALMLGIAYAANIGGMGTLIGTPPNLVFAAYLKDSLGFTVSFFSWMLVALPIVTILFGMVYLLLVFVLFRLDTAEIEQADQMIRREQEKLGRMKFREWMMLAVFLLTASLWVLRETILWFWPILPVTDTSIALLAVFLLFLVPSDLRTGRPLLDWSATQRLPWGILLLFGGGLCLAKALDDSGVIASVAAAVPDHWPYWLVVLALTAVALYLTEVMSNVALVGVFVPVLAGIAITLQVHPMYLAVPATLASSCAFMLPMSTPPNAIVFASGKIAVWQMFLAGMLLNIVAIAVIVPVSQLLLPWFFDLAA